MKDVSKTSANTALRDDRAGNREPTARKESAVAAAPGQAAGLRGMKLGELLRGVETISAPSLAGLEIRGVVCHSGRVQQGGMFFWTHGATADGHAYVPPA